MTEKEKAKAYDKALEKAKYLHEAAANDGYEVHVKTFECLFPELAEPEDERIRKTIINTIEDCSPILSPEVQKRMIAWLEKQGEQIDKGEISDGYHTFNELYYYRMLYNAAFFNLLPKEWTHKSKRHHDGEECFGGGWFIVMANLPTGQISNHYELKDWDLFQIPEKEMADEWDGHTPQEAAERLHKYLEKQAPKTQGKTALEAIKEEKINNANYCSDCTNKRGCINCENGELKVTEQAPKTKWSEEDDGMVACIKSHLRQSLTSEAYTSYRRWLDSLKQRMGGEE